MNGGAGEKSASSAPGAPGALTRLLEKLAAAPEGEASRAWAEGLRPGDLLDDRFEILRELGRGGFGAVYEALDRELGRRVALKTLRPGRDRDEWADEQLRKEAQAAASLSHPGIVTLHEARTCERGPYLVMELLHGETLDERLQRGPLSPAEAVEVGLQISRALAHVHAHGLVHRDLKPGNLLLGDDGRVKLLDLGLAHLLGRKASTGGTPAYVAPEQWRGENVDGRADVFSLGAVLYEALSGRRPFEVKEERSTALDTGEAPTLPGSVPTAMAALVARCLAKNPKARPTAAQVAEELLGVQRAMSGSAPRRWARLAAMVAGALLVAGGVYWLVARLSGNESTATAPAAQPSVAVLPFADMSPGKDQEYFADGVAEEILNALAHVKGLHVVGRTSSFSYKGKKDDVRTIGRELGAASVLEGSVRKEGGRVRITAQLIKAADGYHLWSETFDRELTSVFKIQDEIARAVAAKLAPVLTGRPEATPASTAATTPEAYDAYLMGRHLLSRYSVRDFRHAVEAFEKALAADPTYAPAWAGLASALVEPPELEPGVDYERMKARARVAVNNAVTYGPGLVNAYTTRARIRRLDWDWEGCRADVERALGIDADSVAARSNAGWFELIVTGDPVRALKHFGIATEHDPLNAWAWTGLGAAHFMKGESELAKRAFRRALILAPEHESAIWHLATAEYATGNLEESGALWRRSADPKARMFGEVMVEHALGHDAESRAALAGFIQKYGSTDPLTVAEGHAARGNRNEAFEWLERSFAMRQVDLHAIKLYFFLISLHDDPRWKPLLRKMNLPVD